MLAVAFDDAYTTTEDFILTAPNQDYASLVIADQPLAYWRLGEAAGPSALDLTGNGHHGVADAGVAFGETSLVPGETDTAVRTSGNDRITVPGFEKFGGGSTGYSIEYWITPNSLPTVFSSIVGDGESGGDFYFMNYLSNTGRIRPHYSFANAPVSTDSNAQLLAGQTYHVVTTWDSTTGEANIYIDGSLDKSITTTTNVPSNTDNPVYIGKDNREPGGDFTLDDVAIYNRPLSLAEVQEHYAAQTAGVTGNDMTPPVVVTGVNGTSVVGAPVSTAAGALVTVNGDGSFVYDPNGKFDVLSPGEADVDTFTYEIADSSFNLVQIGPATAAAPAPVPANLATADGATAFAKDVFAGGTSPSHQISHLNDGSYGNAFSWIGASANTFAGVNLNGTFLIDQIAFGRSNVTGGDPCGGGLCTDRHSGTMTIQYTSVTNPSAATLDADWTTIATVTHPDPNGHLRHLYEFTPVTATGVRILTADNGTAIDEIEVYGGFRLVEVGPATAPAPAPVPANLATGSGATAFAKDVFAGGGSPSHQISHLNDGSYGNAFSWIGATANSFAGVNLNGNFLIDQIAFGRSNVTGGDSCGVCTDRHSGTMTIQYTSVPNPSAATLDADWTTIAGVIHPEPDGHLRHLYEFTPVSATGVRILTADNGTAIDEIEVYGGFRLVEVGPATDPAPAPVPANLASGAGATAFAKDVFSGGTNPSHTIPHLNDGSYGNAFSWIGASANTFAGVNLNGSFLIDQIAFGRSNVTGGDPCG